MPREVEKDIYSCRYLGAHVAGICRYLQQGISCCVGTSPILHPSHPFFQREPLMHGTCHGIAGGRRRAAVRTLLYYTPTTRLTPGF